MVNKYYLNYHISYLYFTWYSKWFCNLVQFVIINFPPLFSNRTMCPHHNIAEILLMLALNTNQSINQLIQPEIYCILYFSNIIIYVYYSVKLIKIILNSCFLTSCKKINDYLVDSFVALLCRGWEEVSLTL